MISVYSIQTSNSQNSTKHVYYMCLICFSFVDCKCLLSWSRRPWEDLLTTIWTERGGAACLTSWRRTLRRRFPARFRGRCRFRRHASRTHARATRWCRAHETNDATNTRSCLLEAQLYVLLMEESVVKSLSIKTCAAQGLFLIVLFSHCA